MDPLTQAELTKIGKAVSDYATTTLQSPPKQYSFVALREPNKKEMLSYNAKGSGSYTRFKKKNLIDLFCLLDIAPD